MARIDYERGASAYRAGRTLPAKILERWREAVLATSPARTERVLDLGPGTGQFLNPLAEWLDALVIGVEPSTGMRDEARAVLRSTPCRLIAGRAEALPLRPASVDLAWLSAVVHQFDDLDQAIIELRRVVRPGGRVLVRGYLADTPVTGLFAHFPGIERSAAMFPTTRTLIDAFEAGGFTAMQVLTVVEDWRFTVTDWLARARSLRHVDSLLGPLTDEEFASGVAAVNRLADADMATLTSEMALTLLALAG